MTFFYVASPYSNYPMGHDEAFRAVSRAMGELVRSGLSVFSPITHSHPLAEHGGLDGVDGALWEHVNRPMVNAARGLIVVMLSGWCESLGVQHEICEFNKAGKPVLYYDPVGEVRPHHNVAVAGAGSPWPESALDSEKFRMTTGHVGGARTGCEWTRFPEPNPAFDEAFDEMCRHVGGTD